jgi:hypothetical protein
MTSLHRQDRDLHYPDGSHVSTPPSADGYQLDLWHRRLTRHLDAHREIEDYDDAKDQEDS